MTDKSSSSSDGGASLLRNGLGLAGVVLAGGSLFSFLLLFLFDMLASAPSPYVGILTYVVTPAFLLGGLALMALGAAWQRWKLKRATGAPPPPMIIDWSQPRHRRKVIGFGLGVMGFLLLSVMGSYHAYHLSESVEFCGETCHTVMKPELVTYRQGAHARVSCTECHIGQGASYFVKAKISGAYQLYAVAFDKYPRPIPTPIKHLRPAQDTCEQCHWPRKFVGNLDRTYDYFLGDEENTPYSVRLTLKVGGADPARGPLGGIHWHMNVGNRIEYIAIDEKRQEIPWVRVTDSQGVVTVYRTAEFTNRIEDFEIRTMDCMDCHNRPAHRFNTPNDAVNRAISLGKIDRAIPHVKTAAVEALTGEYETEEEALRGIATQLAEAYPDDSRINAVINVVQEIYRSNFFPEMKADWRAYPDNIGHQNWPGCFRCHDGRHKTADGRRTIKADDCNTCHVILAQGAGGELNTLTPGGQPFRHPGDEIEGLCTDCHDGTF
jgi:nitrate/TMAO reductase-like tetraheme cytochrome c subunit